MTERKYSVREIDQLRRAVENHFLFGRYSGPVFSGNGIGSTSRSYMANEKEVAVEQRTRTFMLAGVTAEDLYESEKPFQKNAK